MEIDDAEADDVIATLVREAPGRSRLIIVLRPGLLSASRRRCAGAQHRHAPRQRHIGPAQVVARYGVAPAQWPCFRALCGDPSDNIPGVRGVGQTTAARLLADGFTLEDLICSGRLTGTTGRRIREAFDQVLAWRELIRARSDLALPRRPSGTPSPALSKPAEVVEKLRLW